MHSDRDDIQREHEPAEEGTDGASISATPREVKDVVQDLLKSGSIESSRKPAIFNHAMRLRNEVNEALDPLDLTMKLDELRGLAILRVTEGTEADPDKEWEHPLVRRKRLTLEQSLLVAVLRHFYLVQEQEIGIGVGAIRVPFDDVLTQMNTFLGDTGSDSKNEQRLLTMLDKLKDHGIVFDRDKNSDITIRPLITYLANPETLTALLKSFRESGCAAGPSVASVESGESDDE